MSFMNHLDNLIPIVPYHAKASEQKDIELKLLKDFLIKLLGSQNLREQLRDYFKLKAMRDAAETRDAVRLFLAKKL